MSKKYVVKRSNIYAGLIIKTSIKPIYSFKNTIDSETEDVFFSKYHTEQLKYANKDILRGTLFSKKLGKTIDLLYDNPNSYPIAETSSSGKIILPDNSDIVIGHSINLEGLLIELGYGDFLTQRELRTVANRLFHHKYGLITPKDIYGDILEMIASSDPMIRKMGEELESVINRFYDVEIKPHKLEPNYELIKRKITK